MFYCFKVMDDATDLWINLLYDSVSSNYSSVYTVAFVIVDVKETFIIMTMVKVNEGITA